MVAFPVVTPPSEYLTAARRISVWKARGGPTGWGTFDATCGSRLLDFKRRAGKDIMLSAGPKTLGPLASTPGLVDE